MKRSMILATVMIGTLLATFTLATEESPTTLPVPSFASLDDKAALDAADKIAADHRRLEQELTSQLDSNKTPANRKVLLIYALGQIRSRWAIPSLLKIVDFPAPFMVGPPMDIARWGQYPVVDALTAIGDTAAYRIADALLVETDELRVRLLLTVIYQVEGAKPGRARIEFAFAKAKDDVSKRNLERAISAFDQLVAQLEK